MNGSEVEKLSSRELFIKDFIEHIEPFLVNEELATTNDLIGKAFKDYNSVITKV